MEFTAEHSMQRLRHNQPFPGQATSNMVHDPWSGYDGPDNRSKLVIRLTIAGIKQPTSLRVVIFNN